MKILLMLAGRESNYLFYLALWVVQNESFQGHLTGEVGEVSALFQK